MDTDKEVGDTVVADGDKITEVIMNYTRQKGNFPSISQRCVYSRGVE